jgi:hypothetical protein
MRALSLFLDLAISLFRAVKRYAYGIWCGLSTLLNALLGGEASETLSYRSAKARRAGKRWGCLLCRFLDRMHADHCQRAIDWWEND